MQAMAHRVNAWHRHLQPILQKCEQRCSFDIHGLGSDIINIFPEDQPEKEINFVNVMENRDQSFTARYFLSLLLLTNTKNVHIEQKHPELNGKVVCRKEDLKIKLLSRERHLDNIHHMDEHMEQGKLKRTAESMADPLPSWSQPALPKKIKQKRA